MTFYLHPLIYNYSTYDEYLAVNTQIILACFYFALSKLIDISFKNDSKKRQCVKVLSVFHFGFQFPFPE